MGIVLEDFMFVYICWKNKDGKELKAYIDHSKVQAFITEFVKRGVAPTVLLPEMAEETISTPDPIINSVQPMHVS